jgi:glutathione S-transferase
LEEQPMMKLYSAPLSLFSRKVEIALHEKGLSFERVMVPFDQSVGYNPKHPDVLAANPKAQVPVLIDGDLTLYDSTIILEYLEEAHPAPALFPRSPADRARCRLLDLYADEIMLVPLRALMHRTGPRPDNPDVWTQAEAKAKEAEGAIRRQLGELNRRLDSHAYFCGALSIADIALFMAVHFSLRLGGPTPNPHGALAGWYARLRARPAFANVVEEILKADLELSAPVEMARD